MSNFVEGSAGEAAEIYFNDAYQDLRDLGFNDPAYPKAHYYRGLLPVLTTAVQALGNRTLSGVGLESPRTNIGELVRGWVESSVHFDDRPRWGVCEESEPKLVTSLNSACNTSRFSPIIVTENDKPVAIVKSEGEKTVFAFHDVPSANLYAHTIADHHSLSAAVAQLGNSSKAWTIDVNQLHEPFQPPIRLSSFIIPPEHRAQLRCTNHWSSLGIPIDYPYDSIFATAQQLVPDATVLPELKYISIREY